MQCVILAGGLGTRMRPLTESIPKAMIPVGGRPFVDYQLSWLSAAGVKEAVFSVGYRSDLIRTYVGEGSRWGVKVVYVDEGADLAGTGGALRLALDAGVLRDTFLVLYGDSFLSVPLNRVWTAFLTSGLPALMTVYRNEGRWETSNVVYEDGRILVYDKTRLHPRSSQMRFVDYGLTALHRSIVSERIPSGQVTDMADVLGSLSLAGQLAGLEVEERFYEVGSPSGLRDFESYVASGLQRSEVGR